MPVGAQRLYARVQHDVQVRDMTQDALLMWGKNDKILDPKYVHEFERDLRSVETHLIDNCGHTAHLEQSEQCARLILKFADVREQASSAR